MDMRYNNTDSEIYSNSYLFLHDNNVSMATNNTHT